MINYNPNINRMLQIDYRRKMKSLYNRVYRGNITFCTLFNINEDSVFNEQLDTYYDNLGEKSPLRFTRIDNYPLFNMQELSLSVDWGFERGLTSDQITVEANIAPFKTQPTTGAFILLEADNNRTMLLKVTGNREESNLEGDMAKRITMELTRYSEVTIERQVTMHSVFLFNRDKTVSVNELKILDIMENFIRSEFKDFITENLDKNKRVLLDDSYTRTLSKYVKGLNRTTTESYNLEDYWIKSTNALTMIVLMSVINTGNDILKDGITLESLLSTSDDADILEELLTSSDYDNLSEKLVDFFGDQGIDIVALGNADNLLTQLFNDKNFVYLLPLITKILRVDEQVLLSVYVNLISPFKQLGLNDDQKLISFYGICEVIYLYFELHFNYDSYLNDITFTIVKN